MLMAGENNEADILAGGKLQEAGGVGGEFLAGDGFDGRGNLAGEIAGGDADGLGSEIEAHETGPGRQAGYGFGEGEIGGGHGA
jgi:hypothetical protein